jgi:hypothetical protein
LILFFSWKLNFVSEIIQQGSGEIWKTIFRFDLLVQTLLESNLRISNDLIQMVGNLPRSFSSSASILLKFFYWWNFKLVKFYFVSFFNCKVNLLVFKNVSLERASQSFEVFKKFFPNLLLSEFFIF